MDQVELGVNSEVSRAREELALKDYTASDQALSPSWSQRGISNVGHRSNSSETFTLAFQFELKQSGIFSRV